jgi:hypothetical protein
MVIEYQLGKKFWRGVLCYWQKEQLQLQPEQILKFLTNSVVVWSCDQVAVQRLFSPVIINEMIMR